MEYLTERGNVFHQNVHTLIPVTTNAMEMIMKRRNAMKIVVQVWHIPYSFVHSCSLLALLTEKPYWGVWEDWTVCSKKCGGGISYRKRKCIPSKCPYSDPRYNKCDGSGYEEKKCNEHCCPSLLYQVIDIQSFIFCTLNRKTILGCMGGLDCL